MLVSGKGPKEHTKGMNVTISLGSGVIAGVAAAIISHPADTLLSKINKAGAGGTGGTASRLINIAKEMGVVKLCLTGLGPRCDFFPSFSCVRPSLMHCAGAS